MSGTDYWAAVAVEVMPSSAVTIVREYDGKYDTRASGSLAVGFLDEMEALGATRGSAGSGLGQRVLQGHVAWVTREWLESCFRSPSWWVALGVSRPRVSKVRHLHGDTTDWLRGAGRGAGARCRDRGMTAWLLAGWGVSWEVRCTGAAGHAGHVVASWGTE